MSTQDDIRSKFRITTDGQRYRVEELFCGRFLWRRWTKWKPMGRSNYPLGWEVAYFSTVLDAQGAMDHQVARRRAEEHGWQPVEDSR